MKEGKLTLLSTLLLVGFLPLIATVLVVNIVNGFMTARSLENSAFSRLEAAANGLRMYYEWDIVNAGEAAYEHDYVDCLKDQDIDQTLFIGNSRYITSILDESGERVEGTSMDGSIYQIISSGEDYQTKKVNVGGRDYYGYYVPVKDGDGKVVGAAFAGEPQNLVKKSLGRSILISTLIAVTFAIIFGIIIIYVANLIKVRILKVITAAEVLSEGDLTHEEELHANIFEFNNLGKAVMLLQKNMKSVLGSVVEDLQIFDKDMSTIIEDVDICNSASDEISKAVDDLTQGSLGMTEDISNTSDSMKEIGNEIDEVARLTDTISASSAEIQEESTIAKDKLNSLMEANEKTIKISNDVVNGIRESSEAVQKIQTATEMITSITSQTSMLALNASIEAARAGEAGKGFAVVASEISSLAAQSDESTKEIQKIVAEIIKSSEGNVVLSNNIKEAIDDEGSVLSEVYDSFGLVNTRVGENTIAVESIAKKVTILDQAKDKVVDAVAGLSSVAEENAASCQETNASMEEMAATITNINQQSTDTMDVCEQLKKACEYFTIA